MFVKLPWADTLEVLDDRLELLSDRSEEGGQDNSNDDDQDEDYEMEIELPTFDVFSQDSDSSDAE